MALYDRFTPQQRQHLMGMDQALSNIQQINQRLANPQRPQRPQITPFQSQFDQGGQYQGPPMQMDLSTQSRFGAPPGTPEWRKTNVSPSGIVNVGPDLGIYPQIGGGNFSGHTFYPAGQTTPVNQAPIGATPQSRAMAHDDRNTWGGSALAGSNYYLQNTLRNYDQSGRETPGSANYNMRLTPSAQGQVGMMNALGLQAAPQGGTLADTSPTELRHATLRALLGRHGIDATQMDEPTMRANLAQVHRGYQQAQNGLREQRMQNARLSAAAEAQARRGRLEDRRTPPSLLEQMLNTNPAFALQYMNLAQRGQQAQAQDQLRREALQQRGIVGTLDALSQSTAGAPYIQQIMRGLLPQQDKGQATQAPPGDNKGQATQAPPSAVPVPAPAKVVPKPTRTKAKVKNDQMHQFLDNTPFSPYF